MKSLANKESAAAQKKTTISKPGLLYLKKSLDQKSFSDALKARGQLFWNKSGCFWVVTGYKLAAECMRNPKLSADRRGFFVERMPEVDLKNLQNFFPLVSQMMVMQDGKQHKKRRKIAAMAMQSYKRDELLLLMGKAIDLLLQRVFSEAWAKPDPVATIDFVPQIANILPAAILAEFFGIPASEREELFAHANVMTAFFGGAAAYTNDTAKAVDKCARQMHLYFKKLISQRRKAGLRAEDLLSKMILSADEHGMDQNTLISQVTMMFVAGVVTTNDQIAHNLLSIFRYTSAAERQQFNLRQWLAVVDEATRVDPAVTFSFRCATEKIEVAGQAINPGETIFFAHHPINRDAEVFSSPDRFDGERKNNKHMGFGLGAHRCVGAGPANMQMAMLFKRFFRLAPDAKVVEAGVMRDHYSLSFSGCKSIPVVLGGSLPPEEVGGVCL